MPSETGDSISKHTPAFASWQPEGVKDSMPACAWVVRPLRLQMSSTAARGSPSTLTSACSNTVASRWRTRDQKQVSSMQDNTHPIELTSINPSQTCYKIQTTVKQGVEDHQLAPQGGHRQLQQALDSLQVAQLGHDAIVVDNGGVHAGAQSQ